MKEVEVTATFSPPPGDWATLSKTSRGTIEALYQHPLSHNLEWSGVVSLFERLGTVDHKGHNEIAFGLGGEHHRVHKPHGKDLTTAEVISSATCSPAPAGRPGPGVEGRYRDATTKRVAQP